LAGSDTAKLRTKVILETMMGELRLKEACERLGICEQRFHQLREEMMTAAVQALEPGQAGRTRSHADGGRPLRLEEIARNGSGSRLRPSWTGCSKRGNLLRSGRVFFGYIN
jgi:hypothetical protein